MQKRVVSTIPAPEGWTAMITTEEYYPDGDTGKVFCSVRRTPIIALHMVEEAFDDGSNEFKTEPVVYDENYGFVMLSDIETLNDPGSNRLCQHTKILKDGVCPVQDTTMTRAPTPDELARLVYRLVEEDYQRRMRGKPGQSDEQLVAGWKIPESLVTAAREQHKQNMQLHGKRAKCA